jgi:hypothetical protein
MQRLVGGLREGCRQDMDEPGACGHEEDLLRGNDGEPHVGVTKLGPAATLDGRLGEADAGGADELGLVAVSVRYSVVLLNLFSLGPTTTRGRSRKSRSPRRPPRAPST